MERNMHAGTLEKTLSAVYLLFSHSYMPDFATKFNDQHENFLMAVRSFSRLDSTKSLRRQLVSDAANIGYGLAALLDVGGPSIVSQTSKMSEHIERRVSEFNISYQSEIIRPRAAVESQGEFQCDMPAQRGHLEGRLIRITRTLGSGPTEELLQVMQFLGRNFDSLSAKESMLSIRLLNAAAQHSQARNMARSILANVADRVTYLLASGPDQPEEFLLGLLRECGLAAKHSDALDNVSAWILSSSITRDSLVKEMRTLYRLRKRVGLKELLLPLVDHVHAASLLTLPVSTLCSAIDMGVYFDAVNEKVIEDLLGRSFQLAKSGENPAPLYSSISKLLAADLYDGLWDRVAVCALVDDMVKFDMSPKVPSDAHIFLAAAMARTGGVSLHKSAKAYSVIEKALRFKTENYEKIQMKLEICRGFRLFGSTVQGSPRRKACDAALHYLTHLQSVIVHQSACIIASFVKTRKSEDLAPSDWSCMFESILTLHESGKTSACDMAEFLIALSESDAPTSLKATVKQTLSPLIRMQIRNESCFHKKLIRTSRKNHDICRSMREELFSKMVGYIRMGTEVPTSHLVSIACLLPLMNSSATLSCDSIDVLRAILERKLLGDSLIFSNRECVNMLNLEGPEWLFLVEFALARIEIDQLTLRGLISVGERLVGTRELDEKLISKWRETARLALLPQNKELESVPDSELLSWIKQKQERLNHLRLFPDGLQSGTTDELKLAFCGFLLTLTAASTLCDSNFRFLV